MELRKAGTKVDELKPLLDELACYQFILKHLILPLLPLNFISLIFS